MNRTNRTLIVLAVAIAVASIASWSIYRAVQRIPERQVEVASVFTVVAARPLTVGTLLTSDDVLEACTAEGIAFMPWAPLGEGLTRGSAHEIRWLLDRSPVILAIPGTSSVEHLEENMRALA